MIMRNDQSVYTLRPEAVGGETEPSLTAAQPGIKQQPHTSGFHVVAVSVASGLERYGKHGRSAFVVAGKY
jgi:hypothetical protein